MNVLEDGTVGMLRRETHGHEPVIIQPIPIHDQATRHAGKHGDKQDGKGNGFGIGQPGDPMNTLTKGDRHAVAQPYSIMPMNSGKDYKARKTDVAQPLMASGPVGGNQRGDFIVQPIAFSGKDYGADASVDLSPTLRAMPHNNSHANGGGQMAILQSMAVRRLTPIECERLQGFPDNYTNIPWRKKEESPDGPRYKALGNSMAVPVMHWIGKRIQMVEDL